MIEALMARVNSDEALVRRGRFLTTTFLLEIGPSAWLISIFEGRVVSVTPGPFVMPSSSFALRASEEEWKKFLSPRPPPGSNEASSRRSMSVTPESLLRGAALALEQCGLLLGDANCLFKNRSYASALVMAAYAREELGRAKILLGFRSDLLDGATVTDEQITESCEDHVRKQRASMASSTLAAETGRVRKLLDERTSGAINPRSDAWQENDAALNGLMKRKDARTPEDRHEARKRALYVQPASSQGWNRPADTSEEAARRYLTEAVNDYSTRSQHPDLLDPLEQLPDRPVLPPPLWPDITSGDRKPVPWRMPSRICTVVAPLTLVVGVMLGWLLCQW